MLFLWKPQVLHIAKCLLHFFETAEGTSHGFALLPCGGGVARPSRCVAIENGLLIEENHRKMMGYRDLMGFYGKR